jgi:hypothetical protein
MHYAKHEREIEDNFTYFQTAVSRLINAHAGEFALLRQRQIVALYPTASGAAAAGHTQFEDGLFSIQCVVDKPYDLGFLSNGSSNGSIV